jgi:hypothetical protein
MAVPWVLGAALWMALSKPVWLIAVLVAARVIGFLAGVVQLRAAGVSARLGPEFVKCSLAAAAIVGGAASVAAHRTVLVFVALAVLGAVELVALWDARGALRTLAGGVGKHGPVELSH